PKSKLNGKIVRERQIQMELYHAAISLLPEKIFVTSKWRSLGGQDFLDLVLNVDNRHWRLHFFVERFDVQDYVNQLTSANGSSSGCQYAAPEMLLSDFTCIKFSPSFEKAYYLKPYCGDVTIELME
ncbi:hypothetical protein HDU91_003331, partial [Kappamyces sp. JEL0680]